MTEEEWLRTDGESLFRFQQVRDLASVRKLRLVAASFLRWLQRFPPYEGSRKPAEIIEQAADQPMSLDEGFAKLWELPGESWELCHVLSLGESRTARELAKVIAFARVEEAITKSTEILHDIFGNPFRPVIFDPRWQTSDVVGLAQAIYDDKAFERMPILADALMDAGCEEEQIIAHCRGEGPHVRGCWVVDLILGKS